MPESVFRERVLHGLPDLKVQREYPLMRAICGLHSRKYLKHWTSSETKTSKNQKLGIMQMNICIMPIEME